MILLWSESGSAWSMSHGFLSAMMLSKTVCSSAESTHTVALSLLHFQRWKDPLCGQLNRSGSFLLGRHRPPAASWWRTLGIIITKCLWLIFITTEFKMNGNNLCCVHLRTAVCLWSISPTNHQIHKGHKHLKVKTRQIKKTDNRRAACEVRLLWSHCRFS